MVRLDFLENPPTDCVEMVIDVGVGKPEHADIQGVEKSGAFLVVGDGCVAEMGVAVEFDGKPFLRTVKVEDVVADTVLTTELKPVKLTMLQGFPQLVFRRGGIIS